MNPSVSLFTPVPTPPPDAKSEKLHSVNQSLYKALCEARQAQSAAEVALNASIFALKEETAQRKKAEEEVKSLLKTKKNLTAKAQMLGAIFKPNVIPKPATDPGEFNLTSLPPEKARFQMDSSSSPLDGQAAKSVITAGGNAVHATQSILYDVLEHQRAQYRSEGYPENEQCLTKMTQIARTDVGEPHGTETGTNVEDPKMIQVAHVPDGGFKVGQKTGSPTPANDFMARTTAESESLTNIRDVTNGGIGMLYQCRPKWAILQNRPLFDDDKELARARSQHSWHQPYSTFWQHPVRYMPASDEKNLCRTLIIDFLPLDTSLRDVLELIRGGALESIQLFPPLGAITDFMTARVVFHYELPADDMCIYWQKYGLTVRGQNIRVLQLGYTYPKNRQLDEDVFIRCYTRILLIDNISDRVIQRLPAYLNRQIKMGFIIEIGQANDGITMIEFTSVVEAARAMRAMQAEEMFHGAVFDFEDDYCEGGSYAY